MGRIPEQTGITGAGTYTINTALDNRLTTLGVGAKDAGSATLSADAGS